MTKTKLFVGVVGDEHHIQVGPHARQTHVWPLTFHSVMDFLIDNAEPNGIHVAYRLSRLVNVWLSRLPAEHLADLMAREQRALPTGGHRLVHFDGFHMDYLPDHFFYVRKGGRRGPRIRIHDVWRFFGRPLPATLAEWKVPYPPDPGASETGALAELMAKFRAGCESVGVVPQRWEGPGAGASVLLRRWGIADHLALDVPDGVRTAARYAYFGHRFEVLLPGHHERIWNLDIRSAYPWAACQIPDWPAGRWVQGRPDSRWIQSDGPATYPTLWHLRWNTPNTRLFGPFPWRYPDGTICYPRRGAGWVWGAELMAAGNLWGQEHFEILECWTFLPGNDVRPWAQSSEVLALRNQFPPVKRFLNAAPGKLAQSWPVPGPWLDPVSAGYVTSLVRAFILGRMSAAGNQVVAVLGDGLLLRRDPKVTSSDEPGGLRVRTLSNCLVVQPSIWFEGEAVAASNDEAHAFGGARAAFEDAWRAKGVEGEVAVAYRHQTSLSEALVNGGSPGVWVDAESWIGFEAPGKRLLKAYTGGYAVTEAIGGPDPVRMATVTEQNKMHSWPFWDIEGRPLHPPVQSWPGAGDEL